MLCLLPHHRWFLVSFPYQQPLHILKLLKHSFCWVFRDDRRQSRQSTFWWTLALSAIHYLWCVLMLGSGTPGAFQCSLRHRNHALRWWQYHALQLLVWSLCHAFAMAFRNVLHKIHVKTCSGTLVTGKLSRIDTWFKIAHMTSRFASDICVCVQVCPRKSSIIYGISTTLKDLAKYDFHTPLHYH